MLLTLITALAAVTTSASTAPEWHHLSQRSLKAIELSYVQLTTPCKNAHAISANEPVSSVAACEAKCTAQAAAAPGTGEAACIAVDTNGQDCFLKSACDGTPGRCTGQCGYRLAGHGPTPPAPPAPPIPPAPPGVTLRQAAAKRGIYVGAATNTAGLAHEPQYKAVEQAEFSLTTAENACKWGPIHPEQDKYTFDDCDAIFAAAAEANQTVRGHNLCWHTENPGWLNNGNFTPAQLRDLLQSHIHTVVTHYGTRALAWDVVNEALDDNGLKPSLPWYPAVPDYIDVAFTAARAAGGPRVKLFYNDYGAESMNAKSGQVYKLVKSMGDRGIPIDGVGLQFHWSLGNHDSLDSVAANMRRIGALGLEVHITELDIKCVPEGSTAPCTPNLLNAQAKLYADILATCLAAPSCTSFETWGFTDKHTWEGAATAPLPFGVDYKAKPAVDAMINLMLNITDL